MTPGLMPGALLASSVLAGTLALQPAMLHVELAELEGRVPPIRETFYALLRNPDTRGRTITLTAAAWACLIAGILGLVLSARKYGAWGGS